MAWPTPQDYNEAIQSPQICFSDPDLKQGTPALTPLGLPRPITGAFASVYQLNCPNRRWAVRCFQREYADQERRYKAISDHLQAVNLPCMVGFKFLPKGILVRGLWYPVLKMEWIDGEPIGDYIARNLNQSNGLRALAEQWVGLMGSLKQARIAHGDLQHGNILVSSGVLKLIDYDAMYVPALNGLSSHEEGHRNFQHPERTGKDYHLDLDNFSAWIIFTSIMALSINPQLWDRLNAGDECLLFRREDFIEPGASLPFRALEQQADKELRILTKQLRSILTLPLAQIPRLDGSAFDRTVRPERKQVQPATPRKLGLPDWLGGQIPQEIVHPSLPQLPEDQDGTNDLDWWRIRPAVNVPRQSDPLPKIPTSDRLIAFSFLIIVISLSGGWMFSVVPTLFFAASTPLMLLGTATIVVMSYKGVDPRNRRLGLEKEILAKHWELTTLERSIDSIKQEKLRLGDPLNALKKEYEKLPQLLTSRFESLNLELSKSLETIAARRRKAQSDRDASLLAIELDSERASWMQAEALRVIEARKQTLRDEEERTLAPFTNQLADLDATHIKALAAIEIRRRNAIRDRDISIRAIEVEAERAAWIREERLRKIANRRRDLQGGYEKLLEQSRAKIDEVNAELTNALNEVTDSIELGLHLIEDDYIKIESWFLTNLAPMEKERDGLALKEQDELDELLRKSIGLHMKMALSKATIIGATIDGIGEALAKRLVRAGITTALEIDYHRTLQVIGIGEAKAASLLDWKRRVQRQAENNAPRQLADTEVQRVGQQYSARKSEVAKRIDLLLASKKERIEAVKDKECSINLMNDNLEKQARFQHTNNRRQVLSQNASNELAARATMNSEMRALEAEETRLHETPIADSDQQRQRAHINCSSLEASLDVEESRETEDYKARRAALVSGKNYRIEALIRSNQATRDSLIAEELRVKADASLNFSQDQKDRVSASYASSNEALDIDEYKTRQSYVSSRSTVEKSINEERSRLIAQSVKEKEDALTKRKKLNSQLQTSTLSLNNLQAEVKQMDAELCRLAESGLFGYARQFFNLHDFKF